MVGDRGKRCRARVQAGADARPLARKALTVTLVALGIWAATAMAGCGRGPAATSLLSTPPPPPLPTLAPGQVVRGRQIYLERCASCHGQRAEGAPNWQQPDARGDLPPPPHDDSGHTWRHSDAQLAEIIRDGLRDPFNKTPELTMPSFKNQLSDEEIQAIIAYFQSLWPPEHRRYQEEQNQRPAMPVIEKTR